MMGGTASSAFLMSFQKYPICSLVTWATFLNLLSLLWPTRSPHTSLLLALGRITLRLTLTSTLALYCTSQVQSPLLKYLVMKKRIRRMSSCLKDAFLFFPAMPYVLLAVSSSFNISKSSSYCLTQFSTQRTHLLTIPLGWLLIFAFLPLSLVYMFLFNPFKYISSLLL